MHQLDREICRNIVPLPSLNHIIHKSEIWKSVSMTIGVISAMDSEHRQLAERLQEKKVADYGNLHYVEGMLGSNRVILTQCGIG